MCYFPTPFFSLEKAGPHTFKRFFAGKMWTEFCKRKSYFNSHFKLFTPFASHFSIENKREKCKKVRERGKNPWKFKPKLLKMKQKFSFHFEKKFTWNISLKMGKNVKGPMNKTCLFSVFFMTPLQIWAAQVTAGTKILQLSDKLGWVWLCEANKGHMGVPGTGAVYSLPSNGPYPWPSCWVAPDSHH